MFQQALLARALREGEAAPNPHMPPPGRRLADASPSQSSGEQAMLKHAGVQMPNSDLLHHEHFSTPNLT